MDVRAARLEQNLKEAQSSVASGLFQLPWMPGISFGPIGPLGALGPLSVLVICSSWKGKIAWILPIFGRARQSDRNCEDKARCDVLVRIDTNSREFVHDAILVPNQEQGS